MATEALGALASVAQVLFDQTMLFLEANAEGKLLRERLGDLAATLGTASSAARANEPRGVAVAADAHSLTRIQVLLSDCQQFVDKCIVKRRAIVKFLLARGVKEDLDKLNVRLDRAVQLLQTDMAKEMGRKQDHMIGKLEDFADRTRRQEVRRRDREKRLAERRREELRSLRRAVRQQNSLLESMAAQRGSQSAADDGAARGKNGSGSEGGAAVIIDAGALQAQVGDILREQLMQWLPARMDDGEVPDVLQIQRGALASASASPGVGLSMSSSTDSSSRGRSLGNSGSGSESGECDSTAARPTSASPEDVEIVTNAAVLPWDQVNFPSGSGPDAEAALLGTGAFSQVFRGTFGPETVAVKVVAHGDAMSNREINSLFEEARVALTARHANVVMIFGVALSPERDQVAIVMELMTLTLWDVLHGNNPVHKGASSPLQTRVQWLADIARAVRYLHFRCIVHADIKSGNVLLDADLSTAKISDFGLSFSDGEASGRRVGTVAYMAPEVIKNTPGYPSYPSDMYSFGILLHETISFRMPFDGVAPRDVLKMVTDGGARPDVGTVSHALAEIEDRDASASLIETMRQCFAADPDSRPAADVVLNSLQGVGSAFSGAGGTQKEEFEAELSRSGTTGIDLGPAKSLSPHTIERAEKGFSLLFGIGRAQNVAEGRVYLRKVAKKGHRTAQAECLLAGEKVSSVSSYASEPPAFVAFKLFSLAGQEGDGLAMARQGFCFENGIGARRDSESALYCYRRAAEVGSVLGMYYYARSLLKDVYMESHQAYDSGDALSSIFAFSEAALSKRETRKRVDLAKQWLEKASKATHANSMFRLAKLLEDLAQAESNLKKAGKLRSGAAELYQEAADLELTAAMVAMGRVKLFGSGTKQSVPEARGWFERASSGDRMDDEGAADGLCYLGMLASRGLIADKGPKDAVRWFSEAADMGSHVAQFEMGKRLEVGEDGVKKNLASAVEHFYRAADGGQLEAQVRLGTCYLFGKGTSADPTLAARWFTKAAAKREPEGLAYLGLCYENGMGVVQNVDRALLLYDAASEHGHANAAFSAGNLRQERAQVLLGRLYDADEQGFPIDRDQILANAVVLEKQAFKSFQQAAKLGNAKAQGRVGRCLLFGRGAKIDQVKAVQRFKKGAKMGDPESMCYFAVSLHNNVGMGENVTPEARLANLVQATTWYEKSAKRDFPAAQLALAQLFYDGMTSPDTGAVVLQSSKSRAFKWFKKAAAHGDNDAQFFAGKQLLLGLGTKANAVRAIRYLKEAATGGLEPEGVDYLSVHADAASAVGVCHLQGLGCEKDESKARAWLELAVAAGGKTAAEHLGKFLLSHATSSAAPDSEDEAQRRLMDATRAVELLSRAASGGSVDAMAELVTCYDRGIGVYPSPMWAHYWRQACAYAGGDPPPPFSPAATAPLPPQFSDSPPAYDGLAAVTLAAPPAYEAEGPQGQGGLPPSYEEPPPYASKEEAPSVEERLCVICIDSPSEYAFIPCGHKCLCSTCKEETFERCPICNNPGNGVMRIFDS